MAGQAQNAIIVRTYKSGEQKGPGKRGMEALLSNATWILVAIGVLAFLVSVITEVTKNVSILKKIPTDIQVIVLSAALSVLSLIIYCQYMKVKIRWFYIAAAVVLSFIVAFIAMYGWKRLTKLWKRFRYDKEEKAQ